MRWRLKVERKEEAKEVVEERAAASEGAKGAVGRLLG
jgi:hypothetical protein